MIRLMVILSSVIFGASSLLAQQKPQVDKWHPRGPRPEDVWSTALPTKWLVAVAQIKNDTTGNPFLELIVPSYETKINEGSKWLAVYEGPNGSSGVGQVFPTESEIKNGKMESGQSLKKHSWTNIEFSKTTTFRMSVPLKDLGSSFNFATDIDNKPIDDKEFGVRLQKPKHVLINFLGWRGSPEKYYASVYKDDMLWISLPMGSDFKYRLQSKE